MGNTAVMLAVIGGILSSMPRQEGILILAQPVPDEARLQPEWVELEHRYLGPDDSTWVTETAPVFLLSMQFDDAMRGWAEDGVLHAPVPLTYDQALALIPGIAVGEIEGARWVLVLLDDCAFTYHFDDAGRTVRVEMDPTADSAVYRFSYGYDAPADTGSGIEPVWIEWSCTEGSGGADPD